VGVVPRPEPGVGRGAGGRSGPRRVGGEPTRALGDSAGRQATGEDAQSKLIITSEGAAAPSPKPRCDDPLIKALVRTHRWRRRIESGQAKPITDLAEQEGVTDAYVCRFLPLTCLAPAIVEGILDGRQPKGLRLAEMLGNGPLAWDAQTETWGFSD
jgi:hypothetical protein